MKRREFLALLTTMGVAWSDDAVGQGTGHARRIGMLLGSSAGDPEMQARVAAFQKQLNALGWAEGSDVHLELPWFGGSPTRAQEFAQELVDLHPDVIVANGTPGIEAVRKVTRSIPTVFVMVGNPVGSGYVASLAHPGGNVTGCPEIVIT